MRILLWLLLCVHGYAASYEFVKEGPVHEAFVVQESGTLLLEAISHEPPAKITELVPSQNQPNMIWIPGYWAWVPERAIFLWVSGVWRSPPPGMEWVAGHWKHYPQGWVWIRGFWTKAGSKDLVDLPMPPDPIDQRVLPPPPSAEKYFWIPGSWEFDHTQNEYVWYEGRWHIMEKDWVYCPATYVWRETGYHFIPGFWDWPLEKRGIVFSAIAVAPKDLETMVYEPRLVLDHLFVMEHLFPYWPRYAALFRFHFVFHYVDWAAWRATPSWWKWPTWDCYPSPALWALWWWWSHPGYPNPSWIDLSLAKGIAPPAPFVVKMMRSRVPPAFVTPYGVVGENTLFEALKQVTQTQLPIIPSNPQQIEQIQALAHPQKPSSSPLMPTAKETTAASSLPKPFLGPLPNSLKSAPRRIILPAKPILSNEPPIEKTTPKPQIHRQKKSFRQRQQVTLQTMQSYDPSSSPQGQLPSHEFSQEPPSYTHPHQRPSMQTQHHSAIMGRPQHQTNPSESKDYSVPGDNSTLPDY
jgi:hypothetical protein